MTSEGQVPQDLIDNRSDSSPDWLRRLPETISHCARKWDLQVGPPFPRLSFNYAAPAMRPNGERVVLKICPPDGEYLAEADALVVFGGAGMVHLLDVDKTRGAMLLERLEPGVPIGDLADDEEATRAALDVMQQFWRPAPPQHRFPALVDWFDRAFALYRTQYGAAGPFDPVMLARTERLIQDLLATSSGAVLLHGDLNYGNVISATRQPWLAIDPKGIVGEPAFDTAILLHDPEKRILGRADPRAYLARRVAQIVAHTGCPRERVVGWGIAYALLSALWHSEYGGEGWRGALACRDLLESLQ